ncbi:MAG: MutS family DNA mismatch repair protein, partial [Clostridium sp.]
IELDEKSRYYNRISLIRLIVGIIGIIYTILSFKNGINLIEGTVVTAIVGLFFMFVLIHIKIRSREKYLNSKREILEKYISRIDGTWVEFEDVGEEAVDNNHGYTGDLDIFGNGSLFQLINSSSTYIGRNTLINTLNGFWNIKDIKPKQLAVKEISSKLDFCVEIQTLGKLYKHEGKDPKQLLEYAKSKTNIYSSKILKYLVYLLPVILIVSSFLAYITLSMFFLNIVFFTLIINIALNGYFLVKGYDGFSKVNPFRRDLKAYLEIIELIEDTQFEEKYLKDIKLQLTKNIKASSVIKKLESIVNCIDIRYNAVAYFILNIIFLWDYQCVFALEDFKKSFGIKIEGYLNAIGRIEEIVSLCVVDQVNPKAILPNVDITDDTYIKGKDIGHPLITYNKRINNDITIDNEILVITGSNMSGKTTFLRTVGINLVLAYSGAPVIANEFSCSYMKILTSMRITDNLEMGISTFYAELIRIKSIIQYGKDKNPMIFLIDEIFRGTNSQDRIIGAKNVLKSLAKPGILGCISTHDFELCNISDDKIKNYHFSEHYIDGKILFDYKIKRGRSTTQNAKYLMKMVGINIEE